MDLQSGWTALHHASAKGNSQDAKFILLGPGRYDVNKQNCNRETPLHLASAYGHTGVVKLLLETGLCEVHLKDRYDRTALHWASIKGHHQVVEHLLGTGLCDVNLRASNQETALHWASAYGHTEVAQLLLETGLCDLTIKDKYDRTPLHWACDKGHLEVVQPLLEKGRCEVNVRDIEKMTALHWAAHNGHELIVKYLLETGLCNLNMKDRFERTPLHWACDKGHAKVVQPLLEREECQVNLQDMERMTALHWAAHNGHESIVKYLLESKLCEVTLKNKYNRTAMDLARAHKGIYLLLEIEGKTYFDLKSTKEHATLEDWRGDGSFAGATVANSGDLKILYLNARSVKSNMFHLQEVILHEEPNIVIVVESWTNDQVSNEDLKIPNYKLVVRKDRTDTKQGRGGGLLIYCTVEIHAAMVEVPAISNSCQVGAVFISGITIYGVYRSPNPTDKDDEELQLSTLCQMISQAPSSSVIIGDFNFPKINWQNYSSSIKRDCQFLKDIHDAGLVQHVREATHINGNCLDLVLSNEEEDRVKSVSLIGAIGTSDHYAMVILINTECLKVEEREKRDVAANDRKDLDKEIGLYGLNL